MKKIKMCQITAIKEIFQDFLTSRKARAGQKRDLDETRLIHYRHTKK